MKFGDEATGVKPKPKGALAALIGGAPSSEPDVSIEVDSEPETDHGFRAVAKAFGIPPEREAAAKDALTQFIKSCSSSYSDDEDAEV